MCGALVTFFCNEMVERPVDFVIENYLPLETQSPAYIVTLNDLNPGEEKRLYFLVPPEGAAPGDWLSVTLNGVEIYRELLTNLPVAELLSIEMPQDLYTPGNAKEIVSVSIGSTADSQSQVILFGEDSFSVPSTRQVPLPLWGLALFFASVLLMGLGFRKK